MHLDIHTAVVHATTSLSDQRNWPTRLQSRTAFFVDTNASVPGAPTGWLAGWTKVQSSALVRTPLTRRPSLWSSFLRSSGSTDFRFPSSSDLHNVDYNMYINYSFTYNQYACVLTSVCLRRRHCRAATHPFSNFQVTLRVQNRSWALLSRAVTSSLRISRFCSVHVYQSRRAKTRRNSTKS